MKVLLTGAGGDVGRALLRDLLADGHDVTGVRRSAAGDASSGARWIVADLAHERLPAEALTGVDAVLHLAGQRYDEAAPAARYREANVDVTTRLLETLAGHARGGMPHVVFFSTIYVYGERSTRPLGEDTAPSPRTAYGASKLAAEAIVRERCGAAGLPWTILRLAAVCGTERPDVLSQMADAYARLVPFVIGAGSQERSLLARANLTRVVRLVLRDPAWRGATVNVADPAPYRMIDLARRVAGPRRVRHVPGAVGAAARALGAVGGRLAPGCDRLGRFADSFTLDTTRLERLAGGSLARAPLLGG